MTDGRRQRTSGPRAAGGYAVEGQGFYVWDEDPREARLTGEALRWADGRVDRARGAGSQPPHASIERT